MPVSNIGTNIVLEADRIYITVYPSDDGVRFETKDTLDYTSETSMFLVSIVRGMIEHAVKDTQETVKLGADAFVAEGIFTERKEPDLVELDDGSKVEFPKTIGSA